MASSNTIFVNLMSDGSTKIHTYRVAVGFRGSTDVSNRSYKPARLIVWVVFQTETREEWAYLATIGGYPSTSRSLRKDYEVALEQTTIRLQVDPRGRYRVAEVIGRPEHQFSMPLGDHCSLQRRARFGYSRKSERD